MVCLFLLKIFLIQWKCTKMGSLAWQNINSGFDSRVAFELRKKGYLICGKTATSEFAISGIPKTLNYYNKDLYAGTSSTGSALSVASKATSISISSQTAGSTIRPASYNGIFAMKPSLTGYQELVLKKDTLDTVSFFGSNLSDLEYTLRDLTVRGPNYPNSAFCEYYSNLKIPKSKKLKIGIPVSYLDDLISEDIKENKRLIAKLKKYGHQIID